MKDEVRWTATNDGLGQILVSWSAGELGDYKWFKNFDEAMEFLRQIHDRYVTNV